MVVSYALQLTAGAGCSVAISSDEKAELLGRKVFPKVIVDSVVFDGPTSLPASTREQLVSDLKEHAGTHWLNEWNEVAIRGAWMDEGFLKMTSAAKAQIISTDATEQHVSVTVHVDEGIQYRLKDIRFTKSPEHVSLENDTRPSQDERASNGKPLVRKKMAINDAAINDAEQLGLAELAFPPEELRKRVLLSEGDLFRASKIRESLMHSKNSTARTDTSTLCRRQ